MAIGPAIRRIFGSSEREISDLYRSIYVDLDAFVDQIRQWVTASNILEIGCGEGAVTERLARCFPEACVTGIDITPRVGRLFQGDRTRVNFRQVTVQDFAVGHRQRFDLLVACDVMHHIPWNLHREILSHARMALKPGGNLILKDWERSRTLIHLMCYSADRYITGDRVRYGSAGELRALIAGVFGPAS
ncbi:MAG TPA: class I SAM-dependent methyltransferase, partial [Rhodocyclaceae bacterium]|nr:class I SAM-dependent methyltransferase [Rhodocyclaceae bacterium]